MQEFHQIQEKIKLVERMLEEVSKLMSQMTIKLEQQAKPAPMVVQPEDDKPDYKRNYGNAAYERKLKEGKYPCYECSEWDDAAGDCYRTFCTLNAHKYGDVLGAHNMYTED